ncbi:hypothetical protein VTN00DRAFT_3919 [Thermoascus crustaceus]|uniref:uncharacterized protein n=1 Tax=Thermoascus crustaceus TaxID=5088 RepID=UPI00374402B2
MRFTRLKKQIENGCFNNNSLKTTPSGEKTKGSKSQKSTKSKAEKEVDLNTGPAFKAEPEEHNTIRMTMRPRNTTIKLEDPFIDYDLPGEIDKYDKYESSEGSLYVAEDVDIESDDDVPLAKKRKMALASSASSSKRVRRSSHGSAKQKQTHVPKDGKEPVDKAVKQEKGAGNGSIKELVKVHGTDKGSKIDVDISMENTKETTRAVESTSTGPSSFDASPVRLTDAFQHSQNRYVADPVWNPLSYSFRSSASSSNRGFPDTCGSSITTDLKRDSLFAFPAQKSSTNPRSSFDADFKREGFMSWRETAARARALQRGSCPSQRSTAIRNTVTSQLGLLGQTDDARTAPHGLD